MFRKLFAATAALSVALVSGAGMGWADDQDRLQLQERTRLMEQIRQDTGMDPSEAEGLESQVALALRAAGDGSQVRSTVRSAFQDGCTGACLRETLRTMTRAMEQGIEPGEAGRMVRAEVRQCLRESEGTGMSDEEVCLMLRNRMEARITTRAQSGIEFIGSGSGGGGSSGPGGDVGGAGRGGSASGGGGGGRR